VARHQIGAHLWSGLSTVWVICGTMMVGTSQQVTDERVASWRLGSDAFILSGLTHLKECPRVSQAIVLWLWAAVAAAPVDQGGD
jgi:hypothetical protein